MKIFCPFTKGECVQECIFYNGIYDDMRTENCNLPNAIINIVSDGFDERSPKDYLESIETNLEYIVSNTGTDQTDSYDIKNELEEVSCKIDKIMKKL